MKRKSQDQIIEVTAYSGYKANERPLYFVLADKKVDVVKVLDRWYGEDYDFFKIRGNDDNGYLIKWHRVRDVWFVECMKC